MSAAKTGTPAREKPSARICNVTVLPVPVAPVTRPCRLPNRRSSASYLWLLPTTIVWSASVAGTAPFSAAAGAPLFFRWAEGFRAIAASEVLPFAAEDWRYSIASRLSAHAGGAHTSASSCRGEARGPSLIDDEVLPGRPGASCVLVRYGPA